MPLQKDSFNVNDGKCPFEFKVDIIFNYFAPDNSLMICLYFVDRNSAKPRQDVHSD